MRASIFVVLTVLAAGVTSLRADIIKDPKGPEVLSILTTYEMINSLETDFLEANEGEKVSISRVRGSWSQGFFLYSSRFALPSGTIKMDKGLFFYCCVRYSGENEFKVDPYNSYGYLCVKDEEKLVPVGYVFQGSGGRDQIVPNRLENLCTDDSYYKDRPDSEGHLTSSVCDIKFERGIPVYVPK